MQTLPMNVAARCAYIPTHTHKHIHTNHIEHSSTLTGKTSTEHKDVSCLRNLRMQFIIYQILKGKACNYLQRLLKGAFENLISFMSF